MQDIKKKYNLNIKAFIFLHLNNREYRFVQNAYMISIRNKEIINVNLERSIERFMIKSHKNVLIIIVIILCLILVKKYNQ